MFIFALGAFLAALGGVIGGAFLGIYPGLDFEMLPLAFAVVIIGGMGSTRRRRDRRAGGRPRRQFRQGAVPGSFLLHALRADGADPRDQADRPVRTRLSGHRWQPESKDPDGRLPWWRSPISFRTPARSSCCWRRARMAFAHPRHERRLAAPLGNTGISSMGQAAYFGVGAYLTAVLATKFHVRAGLGFLAGGRARYPARRGIGRSVRTVRDPGRRRLFPDDHARARPVRLGPGLSLEFAYRRRQRHQYERPSEFRPRPG